MKKLTTLALAFAFTAFIALAAESQLRQRLFAVSALPRLRVLDAALRLP